MLLLRLVVVVFGVCACNLLGLAVWSRPSLAFCPSRSRPTFKAAAPQQAHRTRHLAFGPAPPSSGPPARLASIVLVSRRQLVSALAIPLSRPLLIIPRRYPCELPIADYCRWPRLDATGAEGEGEFGSRFVCLSVGRPSLGIFCASEMRPRSAARQGTHTHARTHTVWRPLVAPRMQNIRTHKMSAPPPRDPASDFR
jgi:hypothetical protein